MRKIYTLLGCILLSQLSNKLSAQVLFSEDFSSATGTTPPAGWSNNDMTMASTPYLWAFDNPGLVSLNAPITDPAAIFNNDYLGWSGDYPESALESPTFDASVITDYIYLSFDHSFFNDDFNGDGSYSVEVWDGSSWNSVMSGSGDVSGHVLLDITADANGASDAQVRFVWYGDYSYYWVVDNVQVEVITCAPVTDVLIDGVTATSADISWTAQGTESSWNIEYGISGFTLGSGTPGTSSTESFSTSTPLTPNTTYDFYVQADCGAGDESPWIGPISVYTGYCEFEGIDSDYYINNFSTTGGATSNISNLNSGFASNGYEDATTMTVSQYEGGPNVNFSVDFGSPGYTYGFGIWVDWNDNMVFESSEQMFQSNIGYQEDFSGSFGVPVGVAVGSYRMRILADYWNSSPSDACTLNSGEGEAEDYTFVVVPIPTCLPVSDLVTDNETTNTIDITWTPGDSETDWNIEWGMPGFVPGTGTGVDSAQQSSSASFTIGGLDPATVYDIYVQASCSSTDSSYWTLVSGTTLCAPIAALPWTEDFEAMTDFDYDLFPLCWLSENGDWLSDNSNNSPGVANSGSNFVGIYYGSNDYLWTPEFQLVAGHKYEFSFLWESVNDIEGWAGSVVVNNSQSSTGATPLGSPFIAPADIPTEDYKREFFCFTPQTSGVYTFGIKVSASFAPYFLSFDDFSLIERAATAGTGSAIDACQLNGLVDLNQNATINDPLGTWTFAPNPTTIVNDSMFNPQFVPAGTVNVDYITYGCLVDTASVMVTIYPPSSAGQDGMITACKNEPIDLLSGLNGTVDLGGDWYSPTNVLMPNSQVMTGTFPGQFNYKYISGNGVCPDDTSSVVVTVLGNCNWLSVDENALEEVTVYPNPSTGVIFIESGFTGNFNLVITDVNGRTVQTGQNTISAGTNTVNLKEVERGTYFLKLSSDNAEKVFRVVIQ
nr:GEVED domain-containing protein [uncultured Fluviicola sp.]